MNNGTNDVAVALANQRMQQEVLPLLGHTHPQPDLWNPLRADPSSQFGMVLVMTDGLVLEIMKSDALMAQTEEIVVDCSTDAMVDDAERFVTWLLDGLMDNK